LDTTCLKNEPEEKNGKLFTGEVTLWGHRGNQRTGSRGVEGGWGTQKICRIFLLFLVTQSYGVKICFKEIFFRVTSFFTT
jgi:hypothetical protein